MDDQNDTAVEVSRAWESVKGTATNNAQKVKDCQVLIRHYEMLILHYESMLAGLKEKKAQFKHAKEKPQDTLL